MVGNGLVDLRVGYRLGDHLPVMEVFSYGVLCGAKTAVIFLQDFKHRFFWLGLQTRKHIEVRTLGGPLTGERIKSGGG